MAPAPGSLSLIGRRLDRVRGAIKSLFLLDGVGRLLIALVVFVVATFVLDWFFILPSPVRLVLLALGLGGIGWIAVRRILYPLGVKISDDDLALFVERHYPELNDRLISAIQLAREGDPGSEDRVAGFNSPQLVNELVRDAQQASEALDFNRVVVRGHVMKIAAWAGALLLVLVGAAVARTDLASIYARRILGGGAKWPQRTYLKVLDFDPATRTRTFARGDDITIGVRADGSDPGKVVFKFHYATGESGEETREAAQRLYLLQIAHLSGPFTFTVEGGDDITEVYKVETQNPPSIEGQLEALFEYPEYLAMENTRPERPEQAGNLQVPLGTGVQLLGKVNEDLASAKLIVGQKGKEKESDLAIENDAEGRPRRLKGGFRVEEASSEYQILLTARNTLQNRDPIRYQIRGLPDQKPAIQVFEPAGDENITEVCKRPVEVTTVDDYGVAQVSMEVRIVGPRTTEWLATDFGPDHNRPRDYDRREKKIRSQHVLDATRLAAKEGEFIEVRFVAKDFRTPQPNVTTSRPYRFAVVSITALEKELQAAIEKIKSGLGTQQNAERNAYDRAGATEKKFSAVDRLSPEQQGEVRGLSFVQQAITEKLATAWRDIDRVRQRGLWNGVFDERSAAALEGAVTALKGVAPAPGDPNQTAASPLAGTLLVSAARASKGERLPIFGRVQALQLEVIEAINVARRHLDHWANLQEIISLVRETMKVVTDAQKGMIPGPNK
jgi:hypothetical protein